MVIGIVSFNNSSIANEERWVKMISLTSQLIPDTKIEFRIFMCNEQLSKATSSGSIVQLPCGDGYLNLTEKTREMRQFVAQEFEFNCFMKIDEDVYLDLPQYYKWLQEKNLCARNVYGAGLGLSHGKITSDPEWKWNDLSYHKRTEMSKSLPYAHGPFYILGVDNVHFLNYIDDSPLDIFKIQNEDMFVGVVLSLKDDLNRIDKVPPSIDHDHDGKKKWDAFMNDHNLP